jgi:hypothetical protein
MALVDRNREPSRRELQWFGVLVAVFLGLVGIEIWRRTGSRTGAWIAWGVGTGAALVYYALPALRWTLYTAWNRAVYPIGWAVSHVLLAAIFFLILTPFGLVMRALGHDPMRRTRHPESESGWVPLAAGTDRSRYFRQS